MSEANKETVRKIQDAWSHQRFDDLDQYFAPEFDNKHSALPGVPAGLIGSKLAHAISAKSFPDRKTEILDMFAEGDKVFMRARVKGSNLGGAPWIGAPAADGKPYEIESWSVYRFEDGKVVEHWGMNDRYGLAMQLGGIKPPAR